MRRINATLIQPFRRCYAAVTEPPVAETKRSSLGDFVLGLSVRRNVAGYALLRFDDLLPLQFGLIDVRKAAEVQQKSLEIVAVLRDLRQSAPDKLRSVAPDDWQSRAAETEAGSKRVWRWVVSVDDSTVDRSPPSNARENNAQKTIAMLQGLVIADAKRLFKVAPAIVHPKRSRLRLGVRSNGPAARQEIFDIANNQVVDFPAIRHRSGALQDDSLLMSDAWASARYAQRDALLADRRQDVQLIATLRQRILDMAKFKRMVLAVEELHPRRAGRELAEAMETNVNKAVDDQLHRILDKQLRRRQRELLQVANEASEEEYEDEDSDMASSDGSRQRHASSDASSPYYQGSP